MSGSAEKAIQVIRNGKATELRSLLTHGLSPNLKDKSGLAIIFLAVSLGKASMISTLLDFDVDLTQKDKAGMTPKDLAYFLRNKKITKVLDGFSRNAHQ